MFWVWEDEAYNKKDWRGVLSKEEENQEQIVPCRDCFEEGMVVDLKYGLLGPVR